MSDERVIPGKTNVVNVCKHIARYNLALPYVEKKKTLDIACGVGYGTRLLSMVCPDVYGVDIDYAAIETANKHYKAPRVTYVRKPFEEMHYAPDKFDAIVSFETIEHIKDLEKAQKNLSRLLNDKGVLVFSVPLNETEGFNEHHHHTFTLDTARELFPDLKREVEYIQIGVNFSQPEVVKPSPFQYYFCVMQKV